MRLLMTPVGACLVAMACCNANAAELPPKKILFDAKVDADSQSSLRLLLRPASSLVAAMRRSNIRSERPNRNRGCRA